MEKIKLANGTEYNAVMVGIGSTFSAQIETEKSFAEVAAEFDNPENTRVIEYVCDNYTRECEGFTALAVVQKLEATRFLVLLGKGNSNE